MVLITIKRVGSYDLFLNSAQKLGIFPLNDNQKQLMSENEWHEVKQKSIKREAFKNACVICKEDFRLEGQVLLSCTHVFHRVMKQFLFYLLNA